MPLVRHMAQVLENRRGFTASFVNKYNQKHDSLTIIMAWPGQIIQKISYGETKRDIVIDYHPYNNK